MDVAIKRWQLFRQLKFRGVHRSLTQAAARSLTSAAGAHGAHSEPAADARRDSEWMFATDSDAGSDIEAPSGSGDSSSDSDGTASGVGVGAITWVRARDLSPLWRAFLAEVVAVSYWRVREAAVAVS